MADVKLKSCPFCGGRGILQNAYTLKRDRFRCNDGRMQTMRRLAIRGRSL